MKRSTSILLYVLLPLFWALVLALGFFIYTFNQDPVGLARSLSARFSAPEAGFALSADQASLSLFPRPAASVSGLTIRTPAMTLFVDEGAVYPDFWALLHGETRIAGVRLLKPTLLLEPPAGTTPETTQQPRFSIPPQLAEMDIDSRRRNHRLSPSRREQVRDSLSVADVRHFRKRHRSGKRRTR